METKRHSKLRNTAFGICALLGGAALLAAEGNGPQQPWSKFKVHDMSRPVPPVVTPGTPSTQEQPGKAPSDAIVLFDGSSLDKWEGVDGKPSPWKLENGAMITEKEYVRSKEEFGDIQLHVEWDEPTPPKGQSQGRGNSGVFLFGKFETQVLDSYQNTTYADGQCGAIYGQYPPQVNASLPPGQWQTYDIIFHRPRYKDGKLEAPAYVTTIQNGVLLQDHQRIEGPTGHMQVAKYPDSMPEKAPIELQYHGDQLRYRNIWVRPLEALDKQQHTGEVAAAPEQK